MKKNYFTIAAVVVLIALLAWQGWTHRGRFFGGSSQDIDSITIDPFARVRIPTDIDAATKAVFEQKIAATKQMYTEKPLIWESWIAIGNLYVLLKDYDSALVAFQKSLDLQSNNIIAHRNMAEVHRTKGDFEQAATQYRLAIQNNFPDTELYIELANLYYKQLKKPDEAEKVLTGAIQRLGPKADLLLALIDLYKTTGNSEKYIEGVQALRRNYPNEERYRRAFPDVP